MYFSIETASTAIGMNACQTIYHLVNQLHEWTMSLSVCIVAEKSVLQITTDMLCYKYDYC